MLSLRIRVPLLGSVGVYRSGSVRAHAVALARSGVTWLLSRTLRRRFDATAVGYQRTEAPFLGVDGISIFFLLRNTRRTPLCILGSRDNIRTREAEYYAAFRAMEGLVNAVFAVTDRLWFYVSFEAVLIPMFLRIGIWGSRARKIRAAYFFFRYTRAGSVLLLAAIITLYTQFGTFDFTALALRTPELNETTARLLWRACFASFAVKVPMLPVHIWLPEAHVEAPTGGSVIRAGILLKLGTYGMMRVRLPRFPAATIYFTPRVYMRAIMAIIYTSLTAIRQTDRKRIIAYASVAHMNFTRVGLFSLTTQGVEGARLQMLSHGLVAGGLFRVIGVVYDRFHTRRVSYYGGRATLMPMYAFTFRVFTMANIALPGTSAFVGEFRIMVGIMQTNPRIAVFSSTGMVLGGAYSLWLFNRVVYGNLHRSYVGEHVTDLNRREVLTFAPLLVFTILRGFYPSLILDTVHTSCAARIETVRRGS